MKRTRSSQRGNAPLFLLVTLLLSIATGVGVYLYLKDYFAKRRPAETTETAPARRSSAPDVAPTVAPAPAPDPEPFPTPAPPVDPPPVDPDAVPDELSIEQVQTTIEAVQERFADCAPIGRLVITLKIRPSGRVEQANVVGADTDEMRDCVVLAAKRIKFPKSGKGLTTRYVLVGG